MNNKKYKIRFTAEEPQWVEQELLDEFIEDDEQQGQDGDADGLCCCQYTNEKGETSHLCEMLCDCEALDHAADKLFKGEVLDDSDFPRIWATTEDRFRIPWRGGAKRIPPDIVFAPVTLLLTLWIGQFGKWPIIISHLVSGFLMLTVHRKVLRLNPQSKFFPAYSISAAVVFVLEYEVGIVGVVNLPRTITFRENLFLVSMCFLTLVFLASAKRRGKRDFLKCDIGSPDRNRRSKYCRVCRAYVVGKDHHCAWLDLCVSRSNRHQFTFCLGALAFALCQFASIALSSVCATTKLGFFDLVLAPADCSSFNPKFEGNPSWAMSCALHAVALVLFIGFIRVQNAISIIRNYRNDDIRELSDLC